MKKQMTARRIIVYLCCLSMVGLLAVGGTYARYIQEVQGQATGSVAAVALGGTLDLTSSLKGLTPGGEKKIEFAGSNKTGTTVSEVALNYGIAIDTTGNLPLTYALVAKSGGDAASYVKATGSSGRNWSGGTFPVGASGATHAYELTVAWPKGSASESLADEIDLVTLTVDAQQIEQEPAT